MLIINHLNSGTYRNHRSYSKDRGNSRLQQRVLNSKYHFLQASTINFSFSFQTKVDELLYVMRIACGRTNVALDMGLRQDRHGLCL